MRLSRLVEGLNPLKISNEGDPVISGLTMDSRSVNQGDLFFAVRGVHFDGNDYLEDAATSGAAAIISEVSRVSGESPLPVSREAGLPYMVVEDIQMAMAMIADRFYCHPSGRMAVIGITGTNGKTTTACILRRIMTESGRETGLMGTIKYTFGNEDSNALLTTPEALEFQQVLSKMEEHGATGVVAEVSSHALSRRRVDFTDFRVSVFTNLTRDHLDYYGGMEEYYTAKKRLFTDLTGAGAVINTDDPYGKRLVDELAESGEREPDYRILKYGTSEDAELRAGGITESKSGISFDLYYAGSRKHVTSPLIGMINVYNILASLGSAIILGIELEEAVNTVSSFEGVEGRLEPVENSRDILALVDYAHTPDALRKVLETLKRVSSGRIITLFGCGGDRDTGKRPLMGKISSELSDLVILTSDNPRSENPEKIISEIEKGVKKSNSITVADRREAICRAAEMAERGDTLLVAGKGHEDYQEILGVRYPFSDREALKESLSSPETGYRGKKAEV